VVSPEFIITCNVRVKLGSAGVKPAALAYKPASGYDKGRPHSAIRRTGAAGTNKMSNHHAPLRHHRMSPGNKFVSAVAVAVVRVFVELCAFLPKRIPGLPTPVQL
jgi:hypothetical protein